jgi:hypothetical protein
MIDINQINPSDYKSFYLTTFVEDFRLYQYTSGGLIEYLDYDKYTTDSGILIAFKSINEIGTDFNYIAKNETKEELVDYQCYENIYEYIEATDYVHNGTVAFFNSVHFPSLELSDKNKIGMDMKRRCDKDSTGPRGFVNSADGVHSYAFDKEKVKTNRKNKTLFLDVREIYHQVDRAHREFTDEHIELVANIVKLYRGDEPSFEFCDKEQFLEQFPNLKYQDIAGLCKIASIEEIEKQSWSLNAGRYVGAADVAVEDYIFEEKLKELNDELNTLNGESKSLENKINHNINQILKNL